MPSDLDAGAPRLPARNRSAAPSNASSGVGGGDGACDSLPRPHKGTEAAAAGGPTALMRFRRSAYTTAAAAAILFGMGGGSAPSERDGAGSASDGGAVREQLNRVRPDEASLRTGVCASSCCVCVSRRLCVYVLLVVSVARDLAHAAAKDLCASPSRLDVAAMHVAVTTAQIASLWCCPHHTTAPLAAFSQVTSFVDASVVYGSDEARNRQLRSGSLTDRKLAAC